ncbi:NAD(P)H-quinone oxidoreductase [Shewanella avicenniae]|uniref:NAD(P)H-quinone oxidoreductase n=1 Tax=Shewanella avicenniae TaxID=2814294 RepID=A0ABX7QQJ5_9GAMM|nr:NAD(P)H-quinone oxidoreductase [Shewanella avicenniae]QSX32961.1 NAD(P)H-quinone oxidoreductase [Shewanella avicenniae]
MRCQQIIFEQPGAPEVMKLGSGEVAVPSAGQVLIKVAAAGVNGPDLFQRQGSYPPPPDASPILGLEVAGEIAAVAEGETRWQVGDNVCALVPGGGYSEYVLTWASHCLPVPQGWQMTEAAALPETFFTVWHNMFMRGGLTAGETVLIQGGGGGIGSTAIMLAKAFGARVITTCSTSKIPFCQQLGADLVVDYRSDDFVEAAKTFTQDQGVQLVLDMVGGDYINRHLKLLSMDGRMVSIAARQARMAEVDVFMLMMKRIVWSGSTLRPQSVQQKAAIAEQLAQQVWPLLNQGLLKPHLHAVLPLAEAATAHQLLEAGQHHGKVVLRLAN